MTPSQIRFAAFDLDGTLTRGPTVAEVFAQHAGFAERMAAFERLTEITDITAAREEMAEWYHRFTPAELCACLPAIPLAPGVDEGFRLLRQHGVKLAIVSITWEFAVAWYAARLGAGYWTGTALASDGAIAHFWPAEGDVACRDHRQTRSRERTGRRSRRLLGRCRAATHGGPCLLCGSEQARRPGARRSPAGRQYP